MSKFRTACIIVRAGDRQAFALSAEVEAFLEARGVTVRVVENALATRPGEPTAVTQALSATPRNDVVLVLGGDGTMLGVARQPAVKETPLLGLNLGRVGFLTDLCPQSWRKGLAAFLQGEYAVHRMMALEYAVTRPRSAEAYRVVHSGRVVNEVVINRGQLARLANLEISVDGLLLDEVRADGVMISTPQGSTGYAISAGGPLVHPDAHAIGVTAICAFMNRFPSMVLPAASLVEIVVKPSTADVFCTLDGQEGFHLEPGDVVAIHRAATDLCFVSLDDEPYLSRLKAKGFLGGFDPAVRHVPACPALEDEMECPGGPASQTEQDAPTAADGDQGEPA